MDKTVPSPYQAHLKSPEHFHICDPPAAVILWGARGGRPHPARGGRGTGVSELPKISYLRRQVLTLRQKRFAFKNHLATPKRNKNTRPHKNRAEMLAAVSFTTARRQDTPRVWPRRHGHPKRGTVVSHRKGEARMGAAPRASPEHSRARSGHKDHLSYDCMQASCPEQTEMDRPWLAGAGAGGRAQGHTG